MSKPILDKQNTYHPYEIISTLFLVLILLGMGIYSLVIPAAFYDLNLKIAVVAVFIYGFYLISQNFIQSRKKKSNYFYGGITIAFGILLLFNQRLPEWIIRTSFGWYCLIASISMLVQACINWSNRVKIRVRSVVLISIYGIIGCVLLFTDYVDTVNLLRIFGIYFILLAARIAVNLYDAYSSSYTWKRGLYIGLPIILGTLLPDAALKVINEKIKLGQDYGKKTVKVDRDAPAKLKVFIHIGSDGFQKIGHITFSWRGMIYSYGNYDTESYRFLQLLGDGVYFIVPEDLYVPNLVKYEHNTLFEYSIVTTPQEDEKIEEQLDELFHRSLRWYSKIERKGKASKLAELEEDYPSRLHYRTGAKFYKFKSGSFKTYWVVGDNCALFSDLILGTVGADVLSVKGILTPGTYYDYLENEYQKENSPIIQRRVHSFEASLTQK